ncbi:MAG: DUF3325 domain-containing protein [Lautropia sp.]|jgi:hypothetical protein|nr:MAG: DUF3325 domain-containing protein [Lautropia sp.]
MTLSTHALAHLLLLALTLPAFVALMLAMERHQEDLLGHSLSAVATRWLRLAGWGLLALALVPAIRLQGLALGLVSWVGHLTLAAWGVYLALVVVERRRALAKERQKAAK